MKIKFTSNTEHRTSNLQWLRNRGRSFDVGRWLLGVGCSRRSQRGVALIITVILLAVVTFMALTFLAVSRRERGAVTTTTDTATARLAADDALASAEARIMANTLATTNPYNFGLLVSTNYINYLGFTPGSASPTNVNYDYLTPTAGGGPLNQNDFLQNLANLQYLPRPPVFYQTNASSKYPLDFRFYLDLNRNGTNDANGLVPEIAANGEYIHQDGSIGPINANVLTNFEVGDPDWVGVLQHPDQPYGPNNPFVARYAFVAVPIGNALDLNHIFNQALDPLRARGARSITVNGRGSPGGPGSDLFLRNQGIGSWEINLAAFLADLNTNTWDSTYYGGIYRYLQPAYANTGAAFDDARALLAYRYDNNYLTLKPADQVFPASSVYKVFPYDNIDEYSDGPLQTNTAPIQEFPNYADNPGLAWAGSPNTNHFFSMDDLYDVTKTTKGVSVSPGVANFNFTQRLLAASQGLSTYDRYTYYRLLAQMGVDSAPEQNKINLNYSNAVASFDGNGVLRKITFFPDAQTNLTPWTPRQFFTIAADRMLREYSREWLMSSPSNYIATYDVTTNIGTLAEPTNMPIPFGISDIPVVVSNRFVYTPAVQRVLQLAANIYDATTNRASSYTASGDYLDFPSVFRPIFRVTYDRASGYTNIYIAGYEPVEYDGQIGGVNPDLNYASQLRLPVNVTDLMNLNYPYNLSPSGHFGPGIYTNVNVYGVPWIIGAKKGFPNFNEFAMESAFQLTRKLQVTRPTTNSPVSDYRYNQMFTLSLSNQFGVECWNSYSNDFREPVAMFVTCTNNCVLTNDEGFRTNLSFLISGSRLISPANYNGNGWPGYNPAGSGASVPAQLLSRDSFQLPLDAQVRVITNSLYRFNTLGVPFLTRELAWPFESNVYVRAASAPYFPQPHWWLMTTNNLRVIILATNVIPYRVIDYVQLRGPDSTRDLTGEILKNYDTARNGEPGFNAYNDLWDTNLSRRADSMPFGVANQLDVSKGLYGIHTGNGGWTPGSTPQAEIDGFRAFFHLGQLFFGSGLAQAFNQGKMTNAMQAPFTPAATVVQHYSWQANDPLVHYTASALNWPGASYLNKLPDNLTNENLGHLNQRYMPWGGYPTVTKTANFNSQNAYNLGLKDPLVWRSDDWNFPTYKMPTVGWLGRVHRGTPWQTVDLKAQNVLRDITISGGRTNFVGTNIWEQWTGDSLLTSLTTNGEYYDAINMAPAQDWLLFDLFSTAPNANATRGQLSVNVDAANPSAQAGLAAWSALFSGVQMLSNTVADPLLATRVQHNGTMTGYDAFPINPAGPEGANSALGQIVRGINQTRAGFVNADGLRGTFEHVGDILSVPQLSDESPFLHLSNEVANAWVSDAAQKENGISDEMYEWLPQQVMSLLRVSGTPQSPMRYVIYSYGQALKPAPNGIYTGGGPYFGMVTNYQVVAESATRTVVNFGSVETNVVTQITNSLGQLHWISRPAVINNTAQIEQFNVLPPGR